MINKQKYQHKDFYNLKLKIHQKINLLYWLEKDKLLLINLYILHWLLQLKVNVYDYNLELRIIKL